MILGNSNHRGSGLMVSMLSRAMVERVRFPFRIDTEKLQRSVIIDVQLPEAVLHIVTSRKRLFSSTVYVFVLWMVGASLILFGVATIFMRNQVKPIRRLAFAAENFGKGRDYLALKPEGANEVRQASIAFLAMRERILNQIRQRTDMLAGVSHDLRTPLTRIRLELEMLTDQDAIRNMKSDVSEMEHMLEGYLSFARGEESEKTTLTNINALVNGVVLKAQREGGIIDFHSKKDINLHIRPNAFIRCLNNIINNAKYYAQRISVTVDQHEESVEIIVDDDGPGIPEDKWVEVFKPFYRLDHSRNLQTGGVGLGLTIVRDIVRSHGGEVTLGKCPGGGLRVIVNLPL